MKPLPTNFCGLKSQMRAWFFRWIAAFLVNLLFIAILPAAEVVYDYSTGGGTNRWAWSWTANNGVFNWNTFYPQSSITLRPTALDSGHTAGGLVSYVNDNSDATNIEVDGNTGDTFWTDSFDDQSSLSGTINSVTLYFRYSAPNAYDGTNSVQYATDETTFNNTTITPGQASNPTTASAQLSGVNNWNTLKNLDIKFINNASLPPPDDEFHVFDVWLVVNYSTSQYLYNFDSSSYTIVAAQENNYLTFANALAKEYRFTFQISQNKNELTGIYAYIYKSHSSAFNQNWNIWNATTGSWEVLYPTSQVTGWAVMDGTITSNCANYVDGNNQIHLAYYATDPGLSSSNLLIDYVKLKVTVVPSPDTTPPAAITNLTATTGTNPGEVNITWTAPGDDGITGNNGPAAYYTVKYATYSVAVGTNSWWNGATLYSQGWSVKPQGQTESYTIGGLTPGTTYYFGIRTTDDAGNTSYLDQKAVDGESTQAKAKAYISADGISPAAISNLTALAGTNEGEILLKWTAPGDDGTDNGNVSGYVVKYATFEITSTNFNNANVSTYNQNWSAVAPGSQQGPHPVTNLNPTKRYYFAVKAYDDANNYGLWYSSSEASVNTAANNYPYGIAPAAISNLTALPGTNEGEIVLKWTAPGDDGTVGTVSSYIVKYATYQITSALFAGASDYNTGQWTNLLGGGQEEVRTITTLATGVTYYFAIKAQDDWGQLNVWRSSFDVSGVNTANFTQAKLIPPAAITDLTALTGTYPGEIYLRWTAPGDDGTISNIVGGEYRIQYTSVTTNAQNPSYWSPSNYNISIATSVSPGATQYYTLTGLVENATYYIRLWTRDENNNNFSGISNGATAQAQITILSVTLSTNTYAFGGLPVSTAVVSNSTITVTNTGNVAQTYSLKISTTIKWGCDIDTPGNDIFVMQAQFNSVKPSTSTFSGSLHGMTTDYQISGGAGGRFAGDQTGQNVEINGTRKIWLLLKTPLSTSTTAEQHIYLNIIGEKAP